ncbi:MAG: HAMP domain-containing histidine kinase [Oscillospiraceae bacterium]|nr:HAMP domain-containing histidine kinase [Oscillospiraceae bacterium]
MDKIKNKKHSLKWKFIIYMSICMFFAILGSFIIAVATNYLQDWYRSAHHYKEGIFPNYRYEITIDENKIVHYDMLYRDLHDDAIYWIISNTQILLIPLWMLLCMIITGIVFYNCELKKPFNIMLNASKQISENKLDFKVEYKKPNELGMLCKAFDEMRLALYKNNSEMWRSLEEYRRLNSAFSHDLRTPLTVLRGYADFLQKYIPDKKISEEKLISVLSMMNGQIERLEHYTQKMNSVQKLEDIIPEYKKVSIKTIYDTFQQTGNFLCKDKNIKIIFSFVPDYIVTDINIDEEIIMQIYENFVSNALRYTKDCISVCLSANEKQFEFSVSDNGKGFSNEALKKASEPFFRDEKNSKHHFGLGLYICRILCEKCGGKLIISNQYSGGGTVKAIFENI